MTMSALGAACRRPSTVRARLVRRAWSISVNCSPQAPVVGSLRQGGGAGPAGAGAGAVRVLDDDVEAEAPVQIGDEHHPAGGGGHDRRAVVAEGVDVDAAVNVAAAALAQGAGDIPL